jgi:hypothetical protein
MHRAVCPSERLPSPIAGVPDDILRLIFLIHIETHGYDRWMIYEWMSLAQVCKRWNHVLMSNPSFFASISMPAGFGSTLRLSRLLKLSKSAPLVVYLSEEKIISGASLLAQHIDRVRDLHLVVRGEPAPHRLALATLFHDAELASLRSLNMDICVDEAQPQTMMPTFENPIAPLRDLRWIGALDWSSPILQTDLRRLQVEQCSHAWHSSPLGSVHAALSGMPSLQLLMISDPEGFYGTRLNGQRDLMLPQLRSLKLEMPARDLAALSRMIVAPVLEDMDFSVLAHVPESDVALEQSLEAVVRCMIPHLEQVARSRPPAHLELQGPFEPAHGTFSLDLRLHATMPAIQDRMHLGYASEGIASPILMVSSSAEERNTMLDLLSLTVLWEQLHLEGLIVSVVIVSAATWHRVLLGQYRIAALDIDAPSCVCLFEALQQYQDFLPGLTHISLRAGELAPPNQSWMTEELRIHLRATFGAQSSTCRKLSALWLEDRPEYPILDADLDSLKECADTIFKAPRSRWPHRYRA